MKKRILIHSPSLAGGGAERVLVLVANELAKRGHEVTLLVWNGEGPNAGLVSADVRLVDFVLPMRGTGFRKIDTLLSLIRLTRFIRQWRPDAVFSGLEFANLITTVALRLSGRGAKFFPGFHAAQALKPAGLGARLSIASSTLIARRATRAIAVSEGVGRDLLRRGYPPEKVVVINNPLPPMAAPTASGLPNPAKLVAADGVPVIVTLGRLVPVKDHTTLLKAFALLRSERPARLVIFGEGPLKSELRRLAQELDITGDVVLAGYASDLAACYGIADLVVLSSTSEGFGNVLIEAMAHGVPVVSTDAPHGPREILDNGRYGPLVPVGDAPALAKTMAATLAQPPSPSLLKRRAADFSIEAIGDRYEALL